MQSAKRHLVIALSFAVCLTVFAAFTPRIAHAVTATLVQVVNTASNPVPTLDVDNGARQAIQLTCATSNSVCTLGTAQGGAYTVPQGKRLVIESVSTWLSLDPGNKPILFELIPGPIAQFLPLTFQASDGVRDYFATASNFRTYSDAGSQVSAFLVLTGGSSVDLRVRVNGYLIDCGTIGCTSQP